MIYVCLLQRMGSDARGDHARSGKTEEGKQSTSGTPAPPKKERKENPRSSLGVIGESISKKPAAGSDSSKKD